jgi:hypothetical protein
LGNTCSEQTSTALVASTVSQPTAGSLPEYSTIGLAPAANGSFPLLRRNEIGAAIGPFPPPITVMNGPEPTFVWTAAIGCSEPLLTNAAVAENCLDGQKYLQNNMFAARSIP